MNDGREKLKKVNMPVAQYAQYTAWLSMQFLWACYYGDESKRAYKMYAENVQHFS